MLDTKPEWVPDWIWTEFEEWSLDEGQYDVPLIEALLRNQHSAVIWSALDRRRGEPKRRLNQEEIPDANRIFCSIVRATEGATTEETFPVRERTKVAKRVARHCESLIKELSDVSTRCDGELPMDFNLEAIDLSQILHKELLERSGDYYTAKGEEYCNAIAFGIYLGCNSHVDTLRLLMNATEQWASTKPLIAHPNNEGAKRLYFLRYMTREFRYAYGTPLRDQVAALVRLIYHCDMDAATVAKLAP